MPQDEQNPYGFDYDPNWRTGETESPEAQPGFVDPQVVPPTTRPAEDFAGTYGFDYDPDWRNRQAAPEEDDYGWGILTAFKRGVTRLRALPDIAQGDYEELAGHFGQLEQYRLSEYDMRRMEELEQTDGFWGAVGYYLRNPTLVGQVVAESLPMMLAPIAGATGGGLAGGAAGGPIGAGVGMVGGGALGSYATEYYNSVGEFFQRQNVDMTNPQQLQAAFNNPELMAAAREFANARGIPIAVFDGLSMGLAGRIYKPARGLAQAARAPRPVAGAFGATAEMGAQAGFGMAGEAGAQLSAEGEITSYPEIVAEGLGEVVPGVVEAGVSRYTQRKARERRAGVSDPTESPLAALDVADEGEGTISIPETDIDPVTGQVVTRTGDPERDTLDRQIEMAMVDLEMTRAEAELMDQIEGETEGRAEAVAATPGIQEGQMLEEARQQEAQEREQQERAAYDQQAEQIAQADIEAGTQQPAGVDITGRAVARPEPAPSEMVTPQGAPVEGQPIDIIEGQPAEGMRTTGPEEALYETGGRPAGTSLGEAMRAAGVRRAVQTTPRDRGPLPPPSTPPEIAPQPDLRDQRAAEALALEEEARSEAAEERAAIQAESQMPVETVGPPEREIPYTEAELAAATPPTPAVEWADKRLADRDYHDALDQLGSETIEGGGITLIPSEELGVTYEGRTPSQNPPWMQGIIAEEKVGRKYVLNVIEKAKAGKRLGPKQQRVLDAMLAEIDMPARMEEELGMAAQAEAIPPEGLQTDMMPEPTGRDAQATADEQQRQRERAAPAADMGVAGDIFTGTSDESVQAAEMEAAQIDIEEVQPGEKGTQRQRKNKAVKKYLQAKRPQADDRERIIGYRTEATLGYNTAVEEGAAPEVIEALRVEAKWAQDWLQENAPEVIESLRAASGQIKPRDVAPGELDALVAELDEQLTRFAEVGEQNMGFDQTEIIGGISKLKLHEDPRAAEYEARARQIIGGEPEGTTEARGDELRQKIKDEGQITEEEAGELEQIEEREYTAALRATGDPADSLVADIEDQHEAWRQVRIQDDWKGTLPIDEVVSQNVRIDRLAEMGDTRASRLVQDMDHWLFDERVTLKSNDERYRRSRKQNKWGTLYGGDQQLWSNGVFVNISQASYSVDYDTLTFKSKEDQARLDRMIEIHNKVYPEKAVPGTPVPTTTPPSPPGSFVINEKRFNEAGPDTYERVFSHDINVRKRVAIDTRLKREGNQFMSLEEADDRITAWEENAIEQGKRSRAAKHGSIEDNFSKVIISLFDTTGVWANPYALAGYDVRALDIKQGIDVTDFSVEFLEDTFGGFDGKEIYGVIAACPCTTFANSSTKWRRTDLPPDHPQNRHENADPEYSRKWIEEMWGKKAAEAVDENGDPLYATPHDYAIALVQKTIQTLEYFRPQFWAVENPEGRIEEAAGLPGPWRTGFQPHNFGDPYTKRTLLWGNFNDDMPTANVDPTEGSKMHMMSPSADRAAKRSETPEGFAYAFFEANNFQDTDPVERTKKDYWYVAGAVEEAFRAGVTEQEIRDNVYLDQSYEPENPDAARDQIRALIEGKTGGPTAPGTPPTTPPVPTESEVAAVEAETVIPTEAQAEAGNYKKPPMQLPGGITFRMETAEGVKRKGYKQAHPYGYIEGTMGADKDPLDMFVNRKMAEDWTGDVYIVDQQFKDVGGFDEHKIMFGFNNMIDARRGYKASYGKDWKGAGPVTKMSLEEFQAWLKEPGSGKKPAALSKVTEQGRKNLKKKISDLRFASGKDMMNAPNAEFVKAVLEGGSKKMGDIPDTMPLNVAVSELLKLQAQREGAPAPPATPSREAIAAAIRPVEDRMPGAPVTLLANYKQAPKAVVKAMQADGMTQVKAVFDPQTNAIYMFADQIKSIDEGVRTALHEKAHRGLREAFGERLDPLLDEIFVGVNETRQQNMQSIVDTYGIDIGTIDGRREVAEELLAHMAEHDVSDNLVNRAVAFIRQVLRDMGFTMEFTDNDIRAIIREAQGSISRRQDRTAGVMIEEEVIVEGTDEVYIVEQEADVLLTGVNQRIEICQKLRKCL